ncbi:MAG: cytochrome c oxidase subunit II transmembrane domain-containing protein, partial [Flavobacteriales bacterium]
LGVIAVAQLTRVYELTRKLSGKREEDVNTKDNRLNGYLMLLFMFLFYAGLIWLMVAYGEEALIHHPASKHGVGLDNLMIFNFVIILAVFFLTQTLLFFFAYKYFGKEGQKAFFYPHNNRLELIWTIVPAIFLAVIIIYGLTTWNRIMDKPSEDALQVGLYGKQFEWIVRYPGKDKELGPTNYLLISTSNPLGIITKETIQKKLKEKKEDIKSKKATLQKRKDIMPDWKIEKFQEEIAKLKRDTGRIRDLKQQELNFSAGYDDKVVTDTLHLPKGREVNFQIRSRDVIHSAYMPHFRAQMNAVPGMKTSFKYTPTITSDSMKVIKQNPDFTYTLICNKICGASHYKMKMGMKVEEEKAFEKWRQGLETFSEAAGLKKAGMAEKKKN